MTKITAEVVAHSINEWGDEAFSLIGVFPRWILSELNTHRMISKNSASSRAIPFWKMAKKVKENPHYPHAWMIDHPGMQGSSFVENKDEIKAMKDVWRSIMDFSVNGAENLNSSEGDNKPLTKQFCNRLLEPYVSDHTVLLTGTEWENFFFLRCPQYKVNLIDRTFRSKKDCIEALKLIGHDFSNVTDEDPLFWEYHNTSGAEIHIQKLAEAIWDAKNESTPVLLKAGEYHLPFGDRIDMQRIVPYGTDMDSISARDVNLLKIKISSARSARTSYENFDGTDDYQKDAGLHDDLLKHKHMSPFEHPMRCMDEEEYFAHSKTYICPKLSPSIESDVKRGVTVVKEVSKGWHVIEYGWSGNVRGFVQYRKELYNENVGEIK